MKKSVRIFWRLFLFGFLAVVLLFTLINYGVFGKMPSLSELENPTIIQASEIFAEDGTLMGRYYLPNGNRSIVSYKEISPNIVNALIATEDKRFYQHSGVDIKGTLRAITLLGKAGGGSTITQQLALALFNKRSTNKASRILQKVKEWIIAVKLEKNFTKEEIIALYLNAVPFSDNIYGIRNASRTFFQKEPDRLSVEEAALLVGQINGPGVYNPRRNPGPARDRRNLVLDRMAENGNITVAEATRLKVPPIILNYKKASEEDIGFAPYFREVLRDEVKKAIKELKKPDGSNYDIYEDGLKIHTTINPTMQVYAEEAVAYQVPRLQKSLLSQGMVRSGAIWKNRDNVIERAMKESDRWRNLTDEGYTDKEIKASFYKPTPMKVFAWNKQREKDTVMTPYDSIKYHRTMVQAAFMVSDPITGEVKAWVGGIGFKTYKLDHANLRVKRQVGSVIKPLLYAQAMDERGMSPESMVDDVQQNFGNGQLVPATGKTCTGRTMTMASALAWSRNCATAYIMKQVGAPQFVQFLKRIGLPTEIKPYPSIALGACELSLYEMMWGYSIFGGRGFSTRPNFITRIEDRNGNVIKQFDFNDSRNEVMTEASAYSMSRMMEGPVEFGTARGLKSRLGAAELAGKTGTTNDNSDAWFMGFSPQLLGGVWVGSDDRFIRNEGGDGYGGEAARPIWEFFFKKVYANKSLGIYKDEKFAEPPQMENEAASADPSLYYNDESNPDPKAMGEDVGVGTGEDYLMDNEQIGPESAPITDEKTKAPQKDTIKKEAVKPAEEKKKKEGFFKRVFGKKKKDDNKEEEKKKEKQ